MAAFLTAAPPPEINTPFWVLSTTMDLATANCWGQNLRHWIAPEQIKDIVWFVIEFKSYDQSRERLQAANIIGAWFDEQAPFDVLMEVWARTRKWDYPGSKIYTLTPLEPDHRLEGIFREPPDSWRFYRMNTRCNLSLDKNFVKQILENELAELAETRLTGCFAKYEGSIYPNFSLTEHVIAPFEMPRQWLHIRGLDLGWSHATACVWAARDLEGRYYVYREYNAKQTSVEDHVRVINSGWEQVLVKGQTYADPAAAATLHEFSLRGLHTAQAQKDVYSGIATVQSLLRPGPDGKPRLYIFNTCPTLIQQLRSYVYDPKTGKPRKETPSCLYDLPDALRYLCHSHKLDTAAMPIATIKLPERPKRINF